MLSVFVGFLAGAFGGLAGLGGGVIMITLMVRFFHLVQKQAHGTSLMAVVFTGLTGALTYYLNGSVDPVAAVLLAATAIVTARFGALYAHSLPEWQLKMAFGFFMILVSLLLLSKPFFAHFSHPVTGWVKIVVLLGSGILSGFLAGMMGVGGGAIMVPALVLLIGQTQHTAQGTSLLAMAPAGAVGAFTHWRLGNVVTKIVPGMMLGIILGTYLGGTLAHMLSEANLRYIFATVLIGLGTRDIRSSIKLRRRVEAAAGEAA